MSTSFIEHFNQLTPAEAERLAILMEECGEVIQIIGKIQRHGYESYNPTVPINERETNRTLLAYELGHVIHAVDRLRQRGDIVEREMIVSAAVKADKIKQYLHHQP